MKSHGFWAGAAILALAGCSGTPAPESIGSDPAIAAGPAASVEAHFAVLGDRYVAALTRLNPVDATRLGEHRYDGMLPDISAAGRAEELAETKALLDELAMIDPARLLPESQVDYHLLDNQLRYAVWQAEDLQQWAWNPQYYNDIASNALYSLVARDFAPWPRRLESAIARMEKLPAFLAEARRQLDPARVPRVHAEVVARQNQGILEVVDAALLPEVATAGQVSRNRFDHALEGLKAAVAEHQTWLDEVLVPQAKGEFRLGPQLYDRKMAFALQSDLTRAELKARAQAAFAEARSEMEALARSLPGCAGGSQQAAIECGLALSYAKRAPRAELEMEARATLAQAIAFTREKGFIDMPHGEVQVITMPKFWQGNAVAYDDAPGPLERHLPNFYAVSPIPGEWSDEQADSFLTEYNMYMLHDLSIHEGVPGHYLQLDHANRYPGMLRAVLQSGPFVEGWAVYSERVMAEQDYLGADTLDGQLFKLTMLKMRLRSITNTLLDIGIHTEGMTREAAMELMMQGAFQQEREAAGKWTRANLSSVQLLSYFTGYSEHMDMRAEAQHRWGNGFTMRRYHDAVLSHGSPPVKYVRALVFGDKVE